MPSRPTLVRPASHHPAHPGTDLSLPYFACCLLSLQLSSLQEFTLEYVPLKTLNAARLTSFSSTYRSWSPSPLNTHRQARLRVAPRKHFFLAPRKH